MKAMVLHNPMAVDRRPLAPEAIDVPRPGPGEILVRVNMCGVCRTDLHVVEGELPVLRSPLIPGHQVAGTVAERGSAARRFTVGDRVGVAWLHDTCGACEFCLGDVDRENLCTAARFTGYSADGGYAEYATVPEAFAYRLPDGFSDQQAAPLLCAGIIGYRALRVSGIKVGQRLGLYGFGASAHIAIQVARHWGCEVYVFTRNEANRRLAAELGAAWTGGSNHPPPAKMHASLIFAPAGPLILDALDVLEKGGTVALAGIYMSTVPQMDYTRHLYDEKVLRSVANATRRDGEGLLAVAAEIPIRTETQVFPLYEANEALLALKTGGISGAAVLDCTEASGN
ncbi:MAG: zinc-dependent alcohol dehydrogenase family protein [Phycisphaerales bacterium]|nr:MAG: zinc-dependent alcohol dehydrogenase family protein [Phycisphaerales bacterium]